MPRTKIETDYIPGGKPLTGRAVLMIFTAFFIVIIIVNVVMASLASRSFSGMVVENSYVASQDFNANMAEARKQTAMGWKSTLTTNLSGLTYTLHGPDGAPITDAIVTVDLSRSVTDRQDRRLTLRETAPGVYTIQTKLPRGRWDAITIAAQGSDRQMRRDYEFFLK